MLTDIENHVCEGCGDNLDTEILERFWKMNSREFVDYLANGGNHLAEIEYHLTRRVDERYANEVLNEIRERYRHDLIISGPLRFWKMG